MDIIKLVLNLYDVFFGIFSDVYYCLRRYLKVIISMKWLWLVYLVEI